MKNVESKRAIRRSETNRIIERQCRIAKNVSPPAISKPRHKYAKQHALDCGKPKCPLCGNPRKALKQKTLKEKQFIKNTNLDFKNNNL